MSKKLPLERSIAKHFSQDIFLSSVGIGCKGSVFFVGGQEKSHFSAIFLV